jgi:hypothetical protein
VQLGRPIHIQRFGAISSKQLYQHITSQEHWRTVLVNVEAVLAEVFPAASAAAGRPIRQALMIVDLKGLGLSQFWAFKSIARRFFHVSQNYYPETYAPSSSAPPPFLGASLTQCLSHHSYYRSMGQLIIMNAPTSFTTIWSMIKPWLAPRTLDKISILGANQPDQHATLLDLVSPENLPVALGGTCTCTYSTTDATDSTSSTNSTTSTSSVTVSSRSDSDVDSSDSDSCSGSSNGGGGGGGGGGGCTLSNAGPWMDGRAERRARWLRGEILKPGVPWPPLQKQEEQAELEQEGRAVEETRGDDENVEEEAEAGPIDAPVASSGTGVAAAPPSSSSASCSRTSVVGLPPLSHPPPAGPVRLVV